MHEWGRGVPCPSVTETLHEAISKVTNKEGEVIQKGINDKKSEILGEPLFCVPIIEVGTSIHPKPCETHPMNQARDALTGTKERKMAEAKPNVATWKRLERKEAITGKGEERVLAKVGGKREFLAHNQGTEAMGTSENMKKKIQDAIPNKFSTAELASQPRRGQ